MASVLTQSGFVDWLRRAFATCVTLALLAGVGIWGHVTDWKFRPHRPVIGVESSHIPTLRDGSLIFPDVADAERLGIDVAPVWTAAIVETLPVSGELTFDPTKVSRLSTRAAGSVRQVMTRVGANVKAGDVVAIVDAAEVGRAKSELLQAIVQVRLRRRALADLKTADVAPRALQEAEAGLREADVRRLSAEQALGNFGLPFHVDELIDQPLDSIARRLRMLGVPDSESNNLLPVRATISGAVIAVDVVAGEVVEAGKPIITVVDPRRLWLTVNVPQAEVKRIAIGQTIRFQADGQRDEIWTKIEWIARTADESTRTVAVRATVANDDWKLRSSTLGAGKIVVRETANAIVVPNDAVQTYGGASVVFVRHPNFLKPGGPRSFTGRLVQVGHRDGSQTEIRSGLAKGEVVASRNVSVLKSKWSPQKAVEP